MFARNGGGGELNILFRGRNSHQVPETGRMWNRVCGRGCDEAGITEEKRLFTESWQGIQ